VAWHLHWLGPAHQWRSSRGGRGNGIRWDQMGPRGGTSKGKFGSLVDPGSWECVQGWPCTPHTPSRFKWPNPVGCWLAVPLPVWEARACRACITDNRRAIGQPVAVLLNIFEDHYHAVRTKKKRERERNMGEMCRYLSTVHGWVAGCVHMRLCLLITSSYLQ
jgi:hypothetical protein